MAFGGSVELHLAPILHLSLLTASALVRFNWFGFWSSFSYQSLLWQRAIPRKWSRSPRFRIYGPRLLSVVALKLLHIVMTLSLKIQEVDFCDRCLWLIMIGFNRVVIWWRYRARNRTKWFYGALSVMICEVFILLRWEHSEMIRILHALLVDVYWQIILILYAANLRLRELVA